MNGEQEGAGHSDRFGSPSTFNVHRPTFNQSYMKAHVLTIGDELLIGQVVNTNAAWIGEQLSLRGVEVLRAVTMGDDVATIRRELARAYEEARLVVITGGLGPTQDDVTKAAVAEFFGVPLRFDARVFEQVVERFRQRGRRSVPESNRSQALVPEGFEPLPNLKGTAPGLWFAEDGGRLLAVLPGVPHEMRYLMEQEVLPRLHDYADLQLIRHRTLLTTGIGESNLQDRLGDLHGFLGPKLRLASLPSTSGVRLRISATGEDEAAVRAEIARFERHLRERIGSYLYGEEEETLEGVVGGMLRARGRTVAVAESCTGGHVVNRLTDVPGASAYVLGGVIAYCNSIKTGLLGVEAGVLAQEGAVSEAVALQMARGVRNRLGADIGISTTGVAGPGGGTPEKPVGTVWIALSDAQGDETKLLRLVDDRELNKALSSTAVLDLIRRRLLARGEQGTANGEHRRW